jgi:hypothetical protein
MLPPLPEAPTFQEWLVVFQYDPNLAQQHFDTLISHIRAAGGGAMAPTHLLMSFRGYHSAQTLIREAATDSRSATKLARETRTGRAMLAAYPTDADWQRLLEDDPATAHEISFALRLKCAHYGIATPLDLQASLRRYADVTHTSDSYGRSRQDNDRVE